MWDAYFIKHLNKGELLCIAIFGLDWLPYTIKGFFFFFFFISLALIVFLLVDIFACRYPVLAYNCLIRLSPGNLHLKCFVHRTFAFHPVKVYFILAAWIQRSKMRHGFFPPMQSMYTVKNYLICRNIIFLVHFYFCFVA